MGGILAPTPGDSQKGIHSVQVEKHWGIPGGIAARFALPVEKQVSKPEVPTLESAESIEVQSPDSGSLEASEVASPSEEDNPQEILNQEEAAPITIELQSH